MRAFRSRLSVAVWPFASLVLLLPDQPNAPYESSLPALTSHASELHPAVLPIPERSQLVLLRDQQLRSSTKLDPAPSCTRQPSGT